MLTLLTKDYPVNPQISIPAKQDYIHSRFEESIVRLSYYFRKSVFAVDNDNILVQLIRHLAVNVDYSDEQYYQLIESKLRTITSGLGINTATNKKGARAKNSFFDNAITEFIVERNLGYPAGINAANYWQNFSPVTFQYHPYNDLALNVRNRYKTEGIEGYAVIYIDIPLLVLQYKHFRMASRDFDVQPTVMQFVYQFPLVNALRSDIDVSYFNRYVALNNGVSATPQRKHYGVALPDVQNYVDDQQAKVINLLTNKPTSLIEVAKSLPLVEQGMVYDKIRVPKFPITAQNLPFVLLGVLPYISFMASISYQSGSADNGVWKNEIARSLTRYKNMGLFRGIAGVNEKDFLSFIEQHILSLLR